MALEKQLADTDSVYCTKITNSNQSSIFISNLGDTELGVLFGSDYKSDDKVRLRLDKRNLAFNAVAHAIDGKTWYKRKSSETWKVDSDWLKARLSTLEDVFTADHGVFIACLNKDDHSTQRLYMKGMTSLSREDGNKVIALRDFLFSGDVIVLTKLDNGDVSFEIKIPDYPIVAFSKKELLQADLKKRSPQLITYGAPGTGKSYKIDELTNESNSIRVTFHPDTDYAVFVGAYKPTMGEQERYALDATGKTHKIEAKEKVIVYSFVPQAFMKAYVEAWRRYTNASLQGDAKTYYLVIEEINRGNCAQIFGDLFQLLDRADNGFSAYAISPDDDIQKFLETDKNYKLADIPLTEDIKKVTETGEKVIATAADIKSGKKLVLPPNLFIRATMNTSDQSLFPMDSAFKRRWDWEYVPIKNMNLGWKIKFGDCEKEWWKFLVAINKIVKGVTNSADKQLGYFFVKAKDSVIDAEMFVNKVAFYLWNDVFKDCELDYDAFKITRDGDEVDVLAFQDFFKDDGTIDEVVLKSFLTKLVPQPETALGESEAGSAADGEA